MSWKRFTGQTLITDFFRKITRPKTGLRDLPTEILTQILCDPIDPTKRDALVNYHDIWQSSITSSGYEQMASEHFKYIYDAYWESTPLVIRPAFWSWSPNRKYQEQPTDPEHWRSFPVDLLQNVRLVRFDFGGLPLECMIQAHPVWKQLADIWSHKNRLQSVVLFVPPCPKILLRERKFKQVTEFTKIGKDTDSENSLSALLCTLRDIVTWDPTDLAVPATYSSCTAICEVVKSGDIELIRMVLEKAKRERYYKREWACHSLLAHAIARGSLDIVAFLLGLQDTDIGGNNFLEERFAEQNSDINIINIVKEDRAKRYGMGLQAPVVGYT